MATIKAGTYVFVEAPTMPSAAVSVSFSAGEVSLWQVGNKGVYSEITNRAQTLYIRNSETTEHSTSYFYQIGDGMTYNRYGTTSGWYTDSDGDIYTATDTTKLRTLVFNSDKTVSDDFYIWFTANTISNKLSVDLTTLPGWANLSSGNHTIKIKAKGSNYRDSELSEGVTVSKSETAVITAGTYRWIAEPIVSKNISANVTGIVNTLTATDTCGDQKSIDTITFTKSTNDVISISNSAQGYYVKYDSTGGSDDGAIWKYFDESGTGFFYETSLFSQGAYLRVISFETDQIVSKEFYDLTIGNGNLELLSNDVFKSIPITRTTYSGQDVSIINNLNKTKVYTVTVPATSGGLVSMYFTYENNQWVVRGPSISILAQTETSITFKRNGDALLEWRSAAALESNNSTYSFWGVPLTSSMPWYVCVAAGTQITLADKTTKSVEDITYDDDLLVWNFYEGKFDIAKPVWIKKPEIAEEYNLCKFNNGAEIRFVGPGGNIGYHRIYNDEAKCFTHTGVVETPVGTTTFAEDSTMPKLISQEVIKGKVTFYNVITDKHYNLFANGILTSCRLSNKYKIEDMKYVGECLITEQEEKEYFDRCAKINKGE